MPTPRWSWSGRRDTFVAPSTGSGSSIRHPAHQLLLIGAGCVVAGTAVGCRVERAGASTGRAEGILVTRLARGTPAARSIQGRTSVATAHARCAVPESLALPVRCGPPLPPDAATLRTAAMAASQLRDSSSVDALRAAALIDLQWGGAGGNSLARSLQSLGQAARYEQTAAAWADLAAAELTQADRDDEPRARLAALDAAARAVSLDSTSVVARFDLALAAERLGLDGRAREEWSRYMAIERDSRWREEAAEHVAAIDRRAVPSPAGAMRPRGVQALAARDPGALRVRVFTEQLGAWSAATLAGDSAGTARALGEISSDGEVLARAAGDSTLADVAREIAATSNARNAAAAAAAFSAGQRASAVGRYADAESLFARAARGSVPTLSAWSATYEAIQQVYTGKAARAESTLRAQMGRARVMHRPALEARAGWTLGVIVLRAGRREEANAILDRVAELSRGLGDRETAAAVVALRGEDRYAAGDERTASRLVIDAMNDLRGHGASLRLRGALNLLAWMADDRGLSGAAAIIRDENAAVSLASGHPEFHAEALLASARSRLLQGDTGRALATLHDAERGAAALPASDVSRWLAANAAQLRARAGVPVSMAALDSAVGYFGGHRDGILLVEALLTRAQMVAPHDAHLAERDLDSAMALMSRRAMQYRSDAERRALEGRIRDIAARSALSRLARRDTMGALGALERGRGGMLAGIAMSRQIALLDFLLVGDTLVAWHFGGRSMGASREVVPARRLALLRDRLTASAESGRGAIDRGASTALYDLLLRRHREMLRGAEKLIIVADDELAAIPFAALYDSAGRGAFVAEQVSVGVAPGLASLGSLEPAPPITHPLFVSDPAFDRGEFAGLTSLGGARTEVGSSRRFYAAPLVLDGAAASTSAVGAAMQRADLVHFASHARFDAERPELSRLVLAPDAAGAGREGLTARAISGMRLRGVRLVVLSSCESTRSGVAGAPVTIGLAKAFHDAGVPAVVGALWRVDDDATAALMAEFHRRYSSTRDAVRALREAQLALLRGPRVEWRDAAAWGAFVVTGR